MAKSVEWNKQVALELIKAGFFAMAKKCHPDGGGSHERMLTLTATKEYLEGVLSGPKQETWTGGKAWDPFRRQEPPRQKRRPMADVEDERPPGMSKYAFGWWYVDDCEIVRTSEKAVCVKPGEGEPFWMPKSQLHKSANEIWEVGDTGTIVFSEWIARQKGWV